MPDGEGIRPVPRVAWDRWLDSLTRAGWSPRPGPGASREDDASDGAGQ